MIKVTFEFETADEAIQAIELLEGGASGAPVVAQVGGEAVAGRKPGRPRKTAPAAEPAPAAATNVPAGSAMSVAPAAPQVPFQAVVDVVTKLADADTPKAKDLLAKFGVKFARDLKPEQFAEVVKAFEAALAAPTPASLI